MKRYFARGSGADRRSVVIEVDGRRMAVVQVKADGASTRNEKTLGSEAETRSAGELMARELLSRGFAEQVTPGSGDGAPVAPLVAAPRPAPKAPAAAPSADRPAPVEAADDIYGLEEAEETAAPVPALARIAPTPDAEKSAARTGRKKKKKRKKAGGGAGPESGELDRRVLAGAGAAGVLIVGFLGYLVFDIFLKPASIVGTWQGSRLDYETGGPMSYAQYRLVLDDQRRASLTYQGDMTSTGTYQVRGDRLFLTFQDDPPSAPAEPADAAAAGGDDPDEGEDGEDAGAGGGGGPEVIEYRIVLGRATLDLYDAADGRKVVQLVRQRERPTIGGAAAQAAAPRELKPDEVAPGDPAAEARLAAVEFSPKDRAFKVRHPSGWEVETGSRPDNTYSWARFTRGGSKIQVFADVVGSLMAGPNTGETPKGSELAPVHQAHDLYRRTIAQEYSQYDEGPPTLFEGSALGEGRIARFRASESGLLGGKVEGYRVTLLSNDRRITVLCQCAGRDLEGMKPTFLAVARSAAR